MRTPFPRVRSPRAELLAAVLVLALASVVRADTVYFGQPGESGIKSVSGTIVTDNDFFLEIKTQDGQTVSVLKRNVYQVIRDTAADGSAGKPDVFRVTRDVPSSMATPGFDSEPKRPRLSHFGLVGGMNISNLSVNPQDLEDQGSLHSFAAGAWWGRPFNRRLMLMTEALYSVKGDAETSGGYKSSTKMTYLDVPVLAKIGFLHNATAHPSLFVGPSLAFNLSAKSTLDGRGSNVSVDVKDDVRTVDMGVVLGGGVEFPAGGHTYGVELRYCKGLTNAVGDNANGTAHNDVLAVMGSVGLQ